MEPKISLLLFAFFVAASLFQSTRAAHGGIRSENKIIEDKHDENTEARKLSSIISCTGGGGACRCGTASDGKAITMNRFYGDKNDEKVNGCGGAFRLNGSEWDAQMDGAVSAAFGFNFVQDVSADGWEGCCWICGMSLQLRGKLRDGWYCEKDWLSTGIWLKGKNT